MRPEGPNWFRERFERRCGSNGQRSPPPQRVLSLPNLVGGPQAHVTFTTQREVGHHKADAHPARPTTPPNTGQHQDQRVARRGRSGPRQPDRAHGWTPNPSLRRRWPHQSSAVTSIGTTPTDQREGGKHCRHRHHGVSRSAKARQWVGAKLGHPRASWGLSPPPWHSESNAAEQHKGRGARDPQACTASSVGAGGAGVHP